MAANTKEMSMAVNIPPNAPQHVYAAAAEQALEWGRADGALEVSNLGLSRHPAYTGLRVFRGEALIKHNRYSEAEEDLRAVLASEPQHPRALKAICYLLMDRQRYREALVFLERAEFVIMGDAEIIEWLGVAEQRAGQEPEAPPPPPSFLFSPEAQSRVQEVLALNGVKSVLLECGGDNRLFGETSTPAADDLKRMGVLEASAAGVLHDCGFGDLTDVSLHSEETICTSRRGPKGVMRVAADAQLREGLIAWHLTKALAEGTA
ncbi:MAG TPA: tetratricopeptide repeat protein [Armatimonadota bacterium]|jgi:tetratricopeptide (TPR) repeat protein